MSDVFGPSDATSDRAHIGSMAEYDAMYKRSIEDAEGFWREQAARVDWFEPFETVKDTVYSADEVRIRWYQGGVLNACYNAVDRHVEAGRGSKTALLFEPDEPDGDARAISYADLHREVQRFANALLGLEVAQGDRVTIYLPMIPEAAIAMLACARIGAVFSVVFAGFSPDAIAGRLVDAESDVVITADEGRRAGKRVPLKANVDAAVERAEAAGQSIRRVLVV